MQFTKRTGVDSNDNKASYVSYADAAIILGKSDVSALQSFLTQHTELQKAYPCSGATFAAGITLQSLMDYVLNNPKIFSQYFLNLLTKDTEDPEDDIGPVDENGNVVENWVPYYTAFQILNSKYYYDEYGMEKIYCMASEKGGKILKKVWANKAALSDKVHNKAVGVTLESVANILRPRFINGGRVLPYEIIRIVKLLGGTDYQKEIDSFTAQKSTEAIAELKDFGINISIPAEN